MTRRETDPERTNPERTASEETSADHDLIFKALSLLLTDVCTTRFELLLSDREPSEAAQEVIDSLDRYDFLGGLAGEASYHNLKKSIENTVGDRAESIIREQNPR